MNETPEGQNLNESEEARATRHFVVPGSRLPANMQRETVEILLRKLMKQSNLEVARDPEHFVRKAVIELFEAENETDTGDGYKAILRVEGGYIYTQGAEKIYPSLTELCKNELRDSALLERLRRTLWVILSPTMRSLSETGGPRAPRVHDLPLWQRESVERSVEEDERARRATVEAMRRRMEEIETRIRKDGMEYALSDEDLKRGTARFPNKELDEVAPRDIEYAAELEILRRHVDRNLPPPTRKEIRASKYLGGLEDILNPYDRGIEERHETEPFTIPGSKIFDIKEQHKLFAVIVKYLAEKGLATKDAEPEQLIAHVVLEWSAEKDGYGILRPGSPYLAIWHMKKGYALIDGSSPESLVTIYPSIAKLVKEGFSADRKHLFLNTLEASSWNELTGWVQRGGAEEHRIYLNDIKKLSKLLSRP